MKDFESEVPCYLYPKQVVSIVCAAISTEASIGENLKSAYANLIAAGLVAGTEMALLDAWLLDLRALSVG
jgi:hypothetical protein